MQVCDFIKCIGAEFYVGVPDSKLRPLCDYIWETFKSDPKRHVVAANEGNCAAIAAGYHLATGKIPVVYMQNSGLGNIVNPAVSLLSPRVYGIPVLFIIGWRGEPGIKDEPQHVYQGEISQKLLDDIGIQSFIIDKQTTLDELKQHILTARENFQKGQSAAILVCKDALEHSSKVKFQNTHALIREEAILEIANAAGDDLLVVTTGKAGRELYELRESDGKGHGHDFLTVGSMGHASSIALGIALHKPEARVWCIDGDGALLMHAGAIPVIATAAPKNLVHIVINNGAHESVGGMPCASKGKCLASVAKAFEYPAVYSATNKNELSDSLNNIRNEKQLCFLEVYCGLNSRMDLGRPKLTPKESKSTFMNTLAKYS